MKQKNMIVWILFLGIVVLLMSTSVQAKELTEVNANDILEKIENGEDIYRENVHIVGELDLSEIKLKTIPNTRTEWEISLYDLEEELKIVESKIEIHDSVFEDDVDFSNTQFRKDIDFSGTSFLGEIDFRGANFSGEADFMDARFSSYADFRDANFSGEANFMFASFGGDVNFRGANFGGEADFMDANFAGYADFKDANFSGEANFMFASFGGDVNFRGANFSGEADFMDADFGGGGYFWGASFGDEASFWDASFSGEGYFESADFSDNATFYLTEFNQVTFTGATFTNVSLDKSDFNRMIVEWNSLEDALVFDGPTYIKLIRNFREIEQFEDADAAYYQYRRLSQANKKWSFSKLMDVVAWLTCGYGVKPGFALIWAFVLIMVFTLVYWLGNGIKRLKENKGDKSRVSRWAAFYNAFYFSVVTFTTVGYGDWYPEDRYRIVVMIEGVFGWLLLALFIVTLANVMIRP